MVKRTGFIIPYKTEEGRLTFIPSPVRKTARLKAAGGMSIWLMNTSSFADKDEITFSGRTIPSSHRGSYKITVNTIISVRTPEYIYTCVPGIQKFSGKRMRKK